MQCVIVYKVYVVYIVCIVYMIYIVYIVHIVNILEIVDIVDNAHVAHPVNIVLNVYKGIHQSNPIDINIRCTFTREAEFGFVLDVKGFHRMPHNQGTRS